MSEQLHSGESLDDEQLAEQLGHVADEIANRVAEHRPVDLSDYMTRYPHLADVLPTVFASVRGLSSWCEELHDDHEANGPKGMQLGDYRLGRELGRGGMGIVYEAEQLSLRRQVAVKVFPFASVLEPNKLKRFKNEALAAATLEHPHIVPVYGVGVDRSTHFYAMRLINGTTLADAIHRFHSEDGAIQAQPESRSQSKTAHTSDLPEQEITTDAMARQSTILSRSSAERQEYQIQIATWIRDAALALHYAHSLGVVHRDVKPTNLLIDDEQQIWVTDFGLATGLLDTHLTLTGDLLGTLAYMSPEQASGDRQVLDHRADVYSLGVTLYEALTGQKPFASGSRAELIRQILSDDAKWPNDLHRAVSTDLRNIAMKAISKVPEERYGSAKALADDLIRYLRGEAVQARSPSICNRATLWVKRNRVVTAAAMIVFACLALATTITYISAHRIKTSSETVKHHLYVADVQLAAAALEKDNVVQARELLSRHVPQAGERDHRGFAWHFLWNRAHPAEFTLAGHNAEVRSVDWSPDGRTIASADESGQVLVWDVGSGKVCCQFEPWKADIKCVRYSPDGKTMAVVDVVGRLAVFESQTGQLLRTVTAHSDAAYVVRFSEDGDLIATCSDDGTIRVSESASLSERFRVKAHGYRIYDVSFHAAGTRLVSVGTDDTIRDWRLDESEPVRQIAVTGEKRVRTRSIAVSPDGQTLISNCGLGQLRKYDLSSGEELSIWDVAAERLYEVRYSADGQYLIVTGKDRLSRIVDADSGEILRTLAGHDRRVLAASFAPDSNRVVTASADGTCKVFPVERTEINVIDRYDAVTGIDAAFSAGARFRSFHFKGRGWRFRDDRHSETTVLPGTHQADGGFSIDFSSTGKLLATSGGPFFSWDTTSGTAAERPTKPLSIDLDLDGDEDVVAAVGPHCRLLHQKRADDGRLSPVKLLPLREIRDAQAVLRYADQDAWDVTQATVSDGVARRYVRSGSQVERLRYELPSKKHDIKLIDDLDGDGEVEIVAFGRIQGISELHTVREGRVTGSSALPIPVEPPTYVVSKDVDLDGRKDLVVARPQRGRIEWCRQNHPLEFAQPVVLAEGLRQPCLLFTEDVDSDGRLDLVTADDGSVVWFRHIGPAAFTDAQLLEKPLHQLEALVPPFANVAIWDTTTGKLRSTLLPLQHNPRSMAMSPDGQTVATCGDDNQVRLRRCDTGDQLAIITLDGPRVESLSFSPDGGTLAIAHGDDCLLWSVANQKIRATLRGHESAVRRAVISPSGDWLATLSHDLTVGLWDTATGRRRRTLFGFTERPYCACFSADEETLAVGTKDGVISLWDVRSGQELCVLTRFDDAEIQAISFRGDRELLAFIYDTGEAVARLQSFRVH